MGFLDQICFKVGIFGPLDHNCDKTFGSTLTDIQTTEFHFDYMT